MRTITAIFLLAICFPGLIIAQDLTRKEELLRFASEHRTVEEMQKAEALRIADSLGLVVRFEDENGKTMKLIKFQNGMPFYYVTDNLNSAITMSSDEVWPGGAANLSLTGSGMTLGVWDGGSTRITHQEFGGRAVQSDAAASPSNHATHVGGTMIAAGVDPLAKGMSYMANLNAYDWDFDASEMAAAAAGGLRVSNHSYGSIRGWYSFGGSWYWYGNVDYSPVEDWGFGFYGTEAVNWDQIMVNAPYYLIVKSAGNDRGEGPGDGGASGHYVWNGTQWIWSTAVRQIDGGPTGYDCLPFTSVAKNIITVGAVNDIPGGYSQPSDVVMSSFSGWGPTDDGRIKPDLVANGISLYSTYNSSNTAYGTMSGTSMASPSISGSVGLLLQHYNNLNGNTLIRSSTMKGLLIHTADEAGAAAGPDYRFGWGLVNTRKAADLMTEDDNVGGDVFIRELTINQGQEIVVPVTAEGNTPLRATIVWTDVPGTPPAFSLDPANLMLVNDLDLRIQKPDNNLEQPYILDPANPANAATTGDNFRDNVEMVHIASPTAQAVYQIKITHKGTLSGGSQIFSLILSGNMADANDPVNFAATSPSATTVNLSWGLNNNNDDVIMLWSETPTFGTLTDGNTYHVGQAIPGGGTVLYMGGLTSFSHTGRIGNTSYYYKIHSIGSGNAYSLGRQADEITQGEGPYHRPRQLQATSGNNTDVQLSWLSPPIEDSFETYTNFNLTFGNWTQVDGDGSPTYTINAHTFPNQGYTGSFIIFNPSQVSPPMTSDNAIQARTGSKYAACFAATIAPNNDWLITPKLKVVSGDQLKFWAKSYVNTYGLERFKVGVSTTGTLPANFTIISAGPYLEAPITWTQYTYDLTAYNGMEVYLAIQCVSDDAFIFMLDDFHVTDGLGNVIFSLLNEDEAAAQPEPDFRSAAKEVSSKPGPVAPLENRSFSTYKVFRDGVEIADVNAFSYTDLNPGNGTHEYTVQSVFVNPAATSEETETEEAQTGLIIWTGSNNSWTNIANWNTNSVPAATNPVKIPATANNPVLSTTETIQSLTIESGAALSIAPSGRLTISEFINNQAGNNGFVIQSDATGTGSLLHQTNYVQGTVQRYIAGSDNPSVTRYHQVAVPQSPSSNPLSGIFTGSYLYRFDGNQSPGNEWIGFGPSTTTPLTVDQGYLLWYTGSQTTYNFPGYLNNGNFTASTPTTATDRFNLVPNPYPSAIDWDAASGWTRSGLLDAIWIWNRNANNYASYISQAGINGGSRYIATGQSFFVRSNAGSASLAMNNNVRTHSNQVFFSSDDQSHQLRLTVSSSTGSDELLLRFVPGTSLNFDPEADVHKLRGGQTAPQMYTSSTDQEELCIQSFEYAGPLMHIPVSFEMTEAGSLNLHFSGMEGFQGHFAFLLEDNIEGQLVDISATNPVVFSHNPEHPAGRFTLLIHDLTGIKTSDGKDKPVTYAHDGYVYIHLPGQVSGPVNIQITDVSGKLIHQSEHTAVKTTRVNPEAPKGVYLVRIAYNETVYSQKVIMY
jgi:hypothetical protein